MDTQGLPRSDSWRVGGAEAAPELVLTPGPIRDPRIAAALDRVSAGGTLEEAAVVALLSARGPDFDSVCTGFDQSLCRFCGSDVSGDDR